MLFGTSSLGEFLATFDVYKELGERFQGLYEDLAVQGRLLFRNPLLEPRVWILDSIFGKFCGLFWLILPGSGASGLRKSIPDDLTDLGTQNDSSGACPRPDFGHFREKCERSLKKSNFEIKKSAIQSLNFLSTSCLSGS